MLSQILFRPPRRPKPKPITEKDKALAVRKVRYLFSQLDAQKERYNTAQTEDIREDAFRTINTLESKILQEVQVYGLVEEDFK